MYYKLYIPSYNNIIIMCFTNVCTAVSHIVIVNAPTAENLRYKCYWKTAIVVIIERKQLHTFLQLYN